MQHTYTFSNGIIKDALIAQNVIMAAGKETHKRQRGSWRRMIDNEAETVEKDLERGQDNSWKQSPLTLLHGGPMLQSGEVGNEST
jgi:hypothetical protein